MLNRSDTHAYFKRCRCLLLSFHLIEQCTHIETAKYNTHKAMNVKDRRCKRHAFCANRTYKKNEKNKKIAVHKEREKVKIDWYFYMIDQKEIFFFSLYFFLFLLKCSKYCASTKQKNSKNKFIDKFRKIIEKKEADPHHHRDGCNEDEWWYCPPFVVRLLFNE
jgi:hypothetical protein